MLSSVVRQQIEVGTPLEVNEEVRLFPTGAFPLDTRPESAPDVSSQQPPQYVRSTTRDHRPNTNPNLACIVEALNQEHWIAGAITKRGTTSTQRIGADRVSRSYCSSERCPVTSSSLSLVLVGHKRASSQARGVSAVGSAHERAERGPRPALLRRHVVAARRARPDPRQRRRHRHLRRRPSRLREFLDHVSGGSS